MIGWLVLGCLKKIEGFGPWFSWRFFVWFWVQWVGVGMHEESISWRFEALSSTSFGWDASRWTLRSTMSSHQVGKYMAACGFADYEHLFKERFDGFLVWELRSGKGISKNTPVMFGGVQYPFKFGWWVMGLVPFKIKLIIVLNNFTTLIDVVKMYQILRVGVGMFSRILHDLISFPWKMHTFDSARNKLQLLVWPFTWMECSSFPAFVQGVEDSLQIDGPI